MIEIAEINQSHIPLVQRYVSDPIIGASSNVPHPYPSDGARAWYKNVMDNRIKGVSIVFAITRDQDFAGVISLNGLNLDTGTANIDYWVRADFHNQGIATEAVGRVLDYAVKLGIVIFKSGCLESNHGSRSVLRKNGFSSVAQDTIEEGKFAGQEIVLYEKLCS